jgi:predicted N-formylglutamate amidohydrolase
MTCEHGGNQVPPRYRPLFHDLHEALKTHRGHDFGTLVMAKQFAAAFKAPLIAATVTRLLVDLNRSVGHPRLHAKPVRNAAPEERAQMIADHYRPYREAAEHLVNKAVRRGQRVIHISSHSFTPELDGQVRTADVGLLYDPTRPGEVAMSARWKTALQALAPALRIRRNYPYAGKYDGFTSYLRTRFGPDAYIGIEVEINQAIVLGPPRHWLALRAQLIESLRTTLASRLQHSR